MIAPQTVAPASALNVCCLPGNPPAPGSAPDRRQLRAGRAPARPSASRTHPGWLERPFDGPETPFAQLPPNEEIALSVSAMQAMR